MRRLGLLATALSLVFAACADDGEEAISSTTVTDVTTTTTVSTTTRAPDGESTREEPPSVDATEIRLTTIEVGDFVFDARVAGPPDGPAVFLLHGFPSTSDQWRGQIPVLAAAGYHVVAPDQRGYSAGARPPEVEDYSLELIAGDLVGMADALGIDRFHVVGHDFGGAATWVIASLHAERVLSMTSISTPHPAALLETIDSADSDQAERSSYVQTFVQEGSELIFVANDGATLRALYASQGLSETEMQPQLDVLNDVDAMRSALNWYRASFNETGLTIGEIDRPTMFIWSTGDEFLGPDPAHLTGDFVTAGYRFEIIADVDHWVPERAAAIVNPLLLDFLADPTAVPPGERVTTEYPAP